MAGAARSITELDISRGKFTLSELSSYAAVGNAIDSSEYNLLHASTFDPDDYSAPRADFVNIEHTTFGVPELWTWAMIGLGFVGSTLAVRRSKPLISAFD